MRRKVDKPGEVTIPHDAVNEQVVIAAAVVGEDEVRSRLVRQLPQADFFFAPEHRVIWTGILEMVRKKLTYDHATLKKLCPKDLDINYLVQLAEQRPDVPVNLNFHVETMRWDYARLTAVRGPIAALIEQVRDPLADQERVRSLARQVGTAFDGYQERNFLRDPAELIRQQMAEIRARKDGHASWEFGLHGLDFFDKSEGEARRRMVPGAAPGLVTVVTGVPGSGKSTTTARLVLGLARARRKVVVGAWEMKGGMTLELLACMSLGFSRADLLEGKCTEEQLQAVEERMHQISRMVRFMDLPFRRSKGEKRSNDANLDLVQGYLADSGCDVFVADLWKRCLTRVDPDDEELALIRQQAMAEELKVHCILVQQQRSKDIEQRPDKRPTREGIKGSGAWTEVADNILGVHRQALWKNVDDNVLEIDILKQRYGKWPIAVEFDWNADMGLITGGTTVPYDNPSGENSQGVDSLFETGEKKQGKRRRRG